MIEGMKSSDGVSYSHGTIWDPEKDKTYKAKMAVKGDDLDVEGCISFVCIGEDWKRVKQYFLFHQPFAEGYCLVSEY